MHVTKLHRKFAGFVLFRLIKKRSFNLLYVLDLFWERWQSTLFRTLCVCVCALGSDNGKELHQDWKQTSVHLLLIPHKSHETAKLFKIHKISVHTNIKENVQTPNTNFWRNSRSDITLIKNDNNNKARKAGICWYCGLSSDLSIPDFFVFL